MDMPLLTKSKYIIGLQCLKYLWISVNDKERIPETDESAQRIFDQGHVVGEIAKKLFPQGIDIPITSFADNLKKSKELVKLRKPLFEPGFLAENLYARADILNPAGKDEWDIIEVKCTAKAKEEHYQDVAFQKNCYEKSGLKIRKCFLMHINTEYVKKGDINPKELLATTEITKEVEEAIKGIDERAELMLKIITSKKCPDALIGKACKKPYECPLTQECWKFLPCNSVFDLYRGDRQAEELMERGILAIKDIPSGFKLNEKQGIQHSCEKTGKPYANKDEIKKFLKTLIYPLYYLDFETVATAIPLYDGTHPYQQIPFQFSLHYVAKENSKPEHFSFLAAGKQDPRKEFLAALKKAIGEKGSIIVFNQAFEEGRLKELAELCPKEKWILHAIDRFVDLLQPFRDFYYYHPKQQGSASIKAVMPALTGKGYEGLEVANGGDATAAFLEMAFGNKTENEKAKIRKELEVYCGRDTEGMIWIVEELGKV